jgi:alkanesulfonate monooxygenase SsuD/methylene tetrahydromethanopterin reductase-like flavin-dependent oxidoreductase (luciferase family)
MSLFEDNSRDALIELSNTVHDVGYESLLLVYDSFLDNASINVANIINSNHTFKYIIAVRAYSVSPEFLASMYETFEKIYPGRVTFNIIPGNIKFHETSISDVVFIENKINSSENRDFYTLEWIKKYSRIAMKKKLPPIMLSGHTDDFQKCSLDYGITNIMQLSDFVNKSNRKDFLLNKNQIVSLAISVEEENGVSSELTKKCIESHKDYTISGSPDYIYTQINKLKLNGVSDILVHALPDGRGSSKIHKVFKDIASGAVSLSKEMI